MIFIKFAKMHTSKEVQKFVNDLDSIDLNEIPGNYNLQINYQYTKAKLPCALV